jgi:hypothetical protein
MVVFRLLLAFTFTSLLTVICRSVVLTCLNIPFFFLVLLLVWFLCDDPVVILAIALYMFSAPGLSYLLRVFPVLRCSFYWTRSTIVVVVLCDVPGMVVVGCCVWYLAMCSDQLLLCGSVLCGVPGRSALGDCVWYLAMYSDPLLLSDCIWLVSRYVS